MNVQSAQDKKEYNAHIEALYFGSLTIFFYHTVRGIPEDKTEKYLSFYEETFGPQSVGEQKEYLYDKQADEYGTGGLGYQMIVEGDTLGIWVFATGAY